MSEYISVRMMGDIVRKHYPGKTVIMDRGGWYVLDDETYLADISIPYPGKVTREEYEELVIMSKL